MPDPDLAELSDEELVDELRWRCAGAGGIEIDPTGRVKEFVDELLRRMESAPEWIPVEEALPEEGEWVLIYLDDGLFHAAHRREDSGEWDDGYMKLRYQDSVTHWQPIQPPTDHE